MDQGNLQWVVEFSIKRGKLAEFEVLVKEISNMVRRFEPGTLKYEWFIDRKENKCIILESYDSSISGIAHVNGQAIKKAFPEILKVAKITRFAVCGNPSDELLHNLAEVNAKVYQFVEGFSR